MTHPQLLPNWQSIWRTWSTWAFGAIIAVSALPDSITTHLPGHVQTVVASLAAIGLVVRHIKQPNLPTPSPIPAGIVPAKSEYPMAEVSTIAEIIAEAPDFIKVIEDGVAIAQAIESKNFAAVIGNAAGYEADVVKAYNDIKALGVSQAVAAGTVMPAAPV